MLHFIAPRRDTSRPGGQKRAPSTVVLGAALAALVAIAPAASAQTGTGTVVFSGNGPTVSYAGTGAPELTFASRVLTGFGNTSVIAGGRGEWWFAGYSKRDMLYGINASQSGNVLEIRLGAATGFDLFLTDALFGGFSNAARYVSYQIFSDDYSLSTSLATVLTGTEAPAEALFGAVDWGIGWGSAIRIQFTETDANGTAIGSGATNVGIQDIGYVVRSPTEPPDLVVPEPSTLVLLAVGLGLVAIHTRRRASAA